MLSPFDFAPPEAYAAQHVLQAAINVAVAC
jgi:hypothetical protein